VSNVAQARANGKVEGKRGVGYRLLKDTVAAEAEDAGEIGLEFVGEVKPEGGETKVSSLRRLEF